MNADEQREKGQDQEALETLTQTPVQENSDELAPAQLPHALVRPGSCELEVLSIFWEEEEHGGKGLRLAEVHERMARRRVSGGYQEPALTTVSTQLRSLLKKGWLEEIRVTLADQANPVRSSRSPLTGYRSKFRPVQVLEPTFKELAGLIPAAERTQALLGFAEALELQPNTIKRLEPVLGASDAGPRFKIPSGFVASDLGAGQKLWVGKLPDGLLQVSTINFETLWQLHPAEYHEIHIHGRIVKTPRWQQAFGRDYRYTALPIPPALKPLLTWLQESINPALNGLLLTWYDARLGHYIGRHRDSIENLIPDTPIVTISLGEERIFRLRRWPAKLGESPVDFPARDGTVFIMPLETNRTFTHEIPRSSRLVGRRISIAVGAFGERLTRPVKPSALA